MIVFLVKKFSNEQVGFFTSLQHDQSQIASDDNLLSNCEERINRLNKETENLRTALEETSSLENTRQQQNLLKNELLSNIKQIQTKLKQSNTDVSSNLYR